MSGAAKLIGLGLAGIAVGVPPPLAIGGIAGAHVGGCAGAAATSVGLVFLGGGAPSAGGLGMAGGT